MTHQEFIDAMKLANGRDDCTCNVAEHSSNPAEHDKYCAFRLLSRAAIEVERAWGVRQWLRRNASAEREPAAKAAFVEAHNAALAILEGRYDDPPQSPAPGQTTRHRPA